MTPSTQRGSQFDPDWCISPGETLRDWMEENKLRAGTTAVACAMPRDRVQGILDGKIKMTKLDAEHLEYGTCIPARLWLNLERAYRAGLAAGKQDVSHG